MLKIFCITCKEELTEKNRYKVKGKFLTNQYCKKCWSNYVNAERREYHSKVYTQTPEGKKAIHRASTNARAKYPEKWDARTKLRCAVKKGEIIKPEYCQMLGRIENLCTDKIQAHHYLGYEGEHWKDVKWLCTRHHAKVHKDLLTQ